jgi:hypothetical protein
MEFHTYHFSLAKHYLHSQHFDPLRISRIVFYLKHLQLSASSIVLCCTGT